MKASISKMSDVIESLLDIADEMQAQGRTGAREICIDATRIINRGKEC